MVKRIKPHNHEILIVNVNDNMKALSVHQDQIAEYCKWLKVPFHYAGFTTVEDTIDFISNGHMPDYLITDLNFEKPHALSGQDLIRHVRGKFGKYPYIIVNTNQSSVQAMTPHPSSLQGDEVKEYYRQFIGRERPKSFVGADRTLTRKDSSNVGEIVAQHAKQRIDKALS